MTARPPSRAELQAIEVADQAFAWTERHLEFIRDHGHLSDIDAAANGGGIRIPTHLPTAIRGQILHSGTALAIHRIWETGKTVPAIHPLMQHALADTSTTALPGAIFDDLLYSNPFVVFTEPVPTTITSQCSTI